jgi:hypothetical protein
MPHFRHPVPLLRQNSTVHVRLARGWSRPQCGGALTQWRQQGAAPSRRSIRPCSQNVSSTSAADGVTRTGSSIATPCIGDHATMPNSRRCRYHDGSRVCITASQENGADGARPLRPRTTCQDRLPQLRPKPRPRRGVVARSQLAHVAHLPIQYRTGMDGALSLSTYRSTEVGVSHRGLAARRTLGLRNTHGLK